MRIVIVTGLSGAGKSTALRALEDHGFYCVDNVPLPLIGGMIDWMVAEGDAGELAIAVDARQHAYLDGYREEIERLATLGHEVDVLYLEASEQALLRRYSASRRRHPLSGTDLVDGIRRDRLILAELRRIGHVIDTSSLNVHQLRGIIQDRYGHSGMGLAVMLLSFGFRHGVPEEANMVFDVRYLRNPYFVPELTERDGRDPEVARYVLDTEEGQATREHLEALLRFVLPQFQKERKLYLTVAIGCTGGRHRSVALVETLRRRFRGDWDVLVKHRDLDVRT
ncbi:RNase adapter RapZ [Haliangium sp.]|uniref:RNase adapter RapZ n=1 Tax=Haliangium sp. TaxID=2663208 RepID=UPI003D0CE871